ncbi:hypothetical protein BOTBODRAFT_562393 [Botryobasidium botryosum FD-172 SS1]|uniref:Uncharacterized protein n=1 Tax=Botryobasidium botryosum (strain FD-172 SS1) TaxID=930990 RepID=A0A067LZB4_BOTB1|nr:hypothetical protein BOTBODRAFT_562393 [Botryobasidium botryosum FD-172 SS1]
MHLLPPERRSRTLCSGMEFPRLQEIITWSHSGMPRRCQVPSLFCAFFKLRCSCLITCRDLALRCYPLPLLCHARKVSLLI